MDSSTGILLLFIGLLAGGYGTIVGAGGGFIFVPALLLIFNMDPVVAAGSGLVIVLINSLSGVAGYAKQKRIDYRAGLTLAAGALPGSLLGVWLLQIYSSKTFYLVFASLLVLLGLFLFAKNSSWKLKHRKKASALDQEGSELAASSSKQATVPAGTDGVNTNLKPKWLIPLGFVMGVISSYLGIGGGWLLVPILIYLFKVPTHNATATSIFSLCLYTSVGVISQLFYGSIDQDTVFWGGIGVILGAQLGVLLSRRIPGKVIIQLLSILLVLIGFRMFFS